MSKNDDTKKPVSKDNEVSDELREEAWDTFRKDAGIDYMGEKTSKKAKSNQ